MAKGAVFAIGPKSLFFLRRTSVDVLFGTSWPFLSSSASSWAASAVNSSVMATLSSASIDVILETGKETVDREGGESSGLMDGDLVCLRLVVLAVNDLRELEADLRRSDADGGLDPDWNGFSSEKGLVPSSRDSLFNLASGSSI